jgi:hypothetical protein
MNDGKNERQSNLGDAPRLWKEFGINDVGEKTPITSPKAEDCDELINVLAHGYCLRSVDSREPLPCFSYFHGEGLAAFIFSKKLAAEDMAKNVALAYEIEVEVVSITGLWDFFQECAFCGFEGIVLDCYYPITFFNRLTDMDRSSPSLMWMRFPDSTNELYGFFFGRMGVVQTETGTTVKWFDYDRMDKASSRYFLFGDPLPEPINAHAFEVEPQDCPIIGSKEQVVDLISPYGASFLGAYISDIGAVPVFTEKKWAVYFAKASGLLRAKNKDEMSLVDGCKLIKVDLFELLERVNRQHVSFVDIGLNPLCHRCRQGWFFKYKDKWMLETISGVWELSPDKFKLRKDVQPPKKRLGGSAESWPYVFGLSSVVQYPFRRRIGENRSPVSIEDAEAILDAELIDTFEPLVIDGKKTIAIDAFVMDAFDKISGDRFATSFYDSSCKDLGFLIFPDLLACCRYIIHELLPHDEMIRTNGYQLPWGGGSVGSRDADREKRITAGIVAAIKKTLLDSLVNGYRPEHGFQMKRLMQDATATVEVTESGYFGDLLFYGTSDGQLIEDRVGTEEAEDEQEAEEAERQIKYLKRAQKMISERVVLSADVESQLRGSLGQSFDMLTTDSKVIAATVVEEFGRAGPRPGYDYAGISMKVAKLIERELKIRLFRPWRIAVRKDLEKSGLVAIKEEISRPPVDRTDDVLIDWLQKKSKLDLGAMRFCLRSTVQEKDSSKVRKLLADFLDRLPDALWLTSSEFESTLIDISTKYRNGGVHEHLVSYETCREALDRILLGPQPVLQRLIQATSQ